MSSTDSTASPVKSALSHADAKRRRYIEGLRDLAAFLAAHPEVEFNPDYSRVSITWWQGDVAGLARAARVLGRVEKTSDDAFLNLERSFGPHKVIAFASHGTVCERVVLGTETVTREEPDPDALKQVPTRTVTEEREIVEWRCPESLLTAGEER